MRTSKIDEGHMCYFPAVQKLKMSCTGQRDSYDSTEEMAMFSRDAT